LGDARHVRTLIARGADPNVKNNDGETPLAQAVQRNQPEALKALLEGGANPNERLKDGSTPLNLAIERNMPGILEALLAGGADATTVDDRLQTTLHRAAWHRRAALVGCLLRYGANPAVSDEVGKTPLHLCVRYAGHDNTDEIVSIIQLLADHGADVSARDQKGRTTLDVIDDEMKYVDRPSVRAKLERIRECLLSFEKEKAERLSVSLNTELPVPVAPARAGGRL
jgi:ankyrin repeat protein